jgi:hypothetical protein
MKKSELRQIIREEIKKINEAGWEPKKTLKGNFHDALDQMERAYDWNYVEGEGNATRFDFQGGRNSMWLYDYGAIDGNVPNDSEVKKVLKKFGFKK